MYIGDEGSNEERGGRTSPPEVFDDRDDAAVVPSSTGPYYLSVLPLLAFLFLFR